MLPHQQLIDFNLYAYTQIIIIIITIIKLLFNAAKRWKKEEKKNLGCTFMRQNEIRVKKKNQ